jgi:hypothetical protein
VRLRRVVTGHGADGRATIVADEPVARWVPRKAIPGMEDAVVWSTAAPPSAPRDGADPTAAVTSVVPAPGETRLLTVTMPPAEVFAAEGFDAAAAAAEDAEVVPGLAERLDPDEPGMHTTPTVDYVIVVEGEVVLVMEDGSEATVRAGDVVVQNATRHGWQNRTDSPATMLVVFVGVEEEEGG